VRAAPDGHHHVDDEDQRDSEDTEKQLDPGGERDPHRRQRQ
jgi:hypothetical protein